MSALVILKINDSRQIVRKMRKIFNVASKASWSETGKEFNRTYREKRFTESHAREAGYTPRQGELMPRQDPRFSRSYTARKLRQYGHSRPLEFSGETRRRLATYRLTAVGGGRSGKAGRVRITYPYSRTLNLKHAGSRIRMSEEFRRILPREAEGLGKFYDGRLDTEMSKSTV